MINIINEAINRKLNSLSFTNIITGKVESVQPIKIKINDRIVIGQSFIEPSSLGLNDYSPNSALPLVVGETVQMVRYNNGQRFYILGKTAAPEVINYSQLRNIPKLVTAVEQPLKPCEEPIKDEIILHKIAKSGRPSDLIEHENLLRITGIGNNGYASYDNKNYKITLAENHEKTTFLRGIRPLILKAGQEYTVTMFLDDLSTTSNGVLEMRFDDKTNEAVKKIHFDILNGSLKKVVKFTLEQDLEVNRIGFYQGNAGVTFKIQIQLSGYETDYFIPFKTYGYNHVDTMGPIIVDNIKNKNLFTGFKIGVGVGASNGVECVENYSATTDYIAVDFYNNGTYYISGLDDTMRTFIAAYDWKRNYIGRTGGSYIKGGKLTKNSFNVAASGNTNDVRYIRIKQYGEEEIISNVLNLSVQLEVGSSKTDYSEYKKFGYNANESMGNVVVDKVDCKNLLNVPKEWVVHSGKEFIYNMEPGTYTISWENIISNITDGTTSLIELVYDDKHYYLQQDIGKKGKITFTAKKIFNRMVVYSQQDWATSQGKSVVYRKLMVEKGSDITPYTEHRKYGYNSFESMGNIIADTIEGKNLWGDDVTLTANRDLDRNLANPLEAGVYTLSWSNMTTDSTTTPLISFRTADNTQIQSIFLPLDKNYITFTLLQPAYMFRFYPSNNYANSAGKSTVIEKVQLEKGDKPTEYTSYRKFGYESGSKPNGSWIKYDDGTLIQYMGKSCPITFSGNTWGSMWECDPYDLGNYPIPFKETPESLNITITGYTGGFLESVGNRSETHIGDVYICRPMQSNGTHNYYLSIIAVGKWK